MPKSITAPATPSTLKIMPEQLVTCPVCHIPNFTARGLKAHRCKGGTRMNPETGLVETIPPLSVLAQAAAARRQATDAEIVPPSWERARSILSGITLALRLSLAGQVMLGAELQELKKALGFIHGKNQHSRTPQVAESSTWAALVKAELTISVDTADRMIAMWEAAKLKLKKLGGAPALIGILECPPAALDAIQRQTLEAAVAKVTDGESQKTLLEELRLVKRYDVIKGGDTSAHRKPKDEDEAIGQLAFAFFSPVADALQAACTHPDRQALYTALAHAHPARLLEMEQSLESALHDVRAAKATRVNPR